MNFFGTKIKGYFIFNFTLKYLNFTMLWVSHLWLVTHHMCVYVGALRVGAEKNKTTVPMRVVRGE
jgi:hypothetical protein